MEVRFYSEDGKIYSGKSDGVITMWMDRRNPDMMGFEARVKLQSFPSFELTGEVKIVVVAKVGKKVLSTRTFLTNKLTVNKGPSSHTLFCLIKNVDMNDYFERINEYTL